MERVGDDGITETFHPQPGEPTSAWRGLRSGCDEKKPVRRTYRVSHVRLEVEARRRAEDVVVGLHQLLLVTVGLQALGGAVQHLQARVLGRLHVLLGRQVGPQGSVQAGVVAQVTALRNTRRTLEASQLDLHRAEKTRHACLLCSFSSRKVTFLVERLASD